MPKSIWTSSKNNLYRSVNRNHFRMRNAHSVRKWVPESHFWSSQKIWKWVPNATFSTKFSSLRAPKKFFHIGYHSYRYLKVCPRVTEQARKRIRMIRLIFQKISREQEILGTKKSFLGYHCRCIWVKRQALLQDQKDSLQNRSQFRFKTSAGDNEIFSSPVQDLQISPPLENVRKIREEVL